MSKVLAVSKAPRPFTPKCYEGVSPTPVFTIISMTKREWLLFLKQETSGIPKESKEGSPEEITDTTFDALCYGIDGNARLFDKHLTGWNNVPAQGGVSLEYGRDNFDCLPDKVVAELIKEISGQVSDEDAKNSEKPSESANG